MCGLWTFITCRHSHTVNRNRINVHWSMRNQLPTNHSSSPCLRTDLLICLCLCVLYSMCVRRTRPTTTLSTRARSQPVLGLRITVYLSVILRSSSRPALETMKRKTEHSERVYLDLLFTHSNLHLFYCYCTTTAESPAGPWHDRSLDSRWAASRMKCVGQPRPFDVGRVRRLCGQALILEFVVFCLWRSKSLCFTQFLSPVVLCTLLLSSKSCKYGGWYIYPRIVGDSATEVAYQAQGTRTEDLHALPLPAQVV